MKTSAYCPTCQRTHKCWMHISEEFQYCVVDDGTDSRVCNGCNHVAKITRRTSKNRAEVEALFLELMK